MDVDLRKKILLVDDSALMRRVLCDIINSDKRFQVSAKAADGLEAFDLLSRESFDGVVLDINMPRMNGLELLRELRKFHIRARVMIASTDSAEGADVTLDALELGALDFIQKPGTSYACRSEAFMKEFLDTLYAVSLARLPVSDTVKRPAAGERKLSNRQTPTHSAAEQTRTEASSEAQKPINVRALPPKTAGRVNRRIVAIASSTGGPRALQNVIPKLPRELAAPVVLVQHMPKGFTASLASRLDGLSAVKVKEAAEGDVLENGVVYVAMGGFHLNVIVGPGGQHVIHYTDEPTREGVKPSANYMYESLAGTKYTDILCVVMTGMGADGREGIQNLKKKKSIAVYAQSKSTCVVYGMPKSVTLAGLSDREIDLDAIGDMITDWVKR